MFPDTLLEVRNSELRQESQSKELGGRCMGVGRAPSTADGSQGVTAKRPSLLGALQGQCVYCWCGAMSTSPGPRCIRLRQLGKGGDRAGCFQISREVFVLSSLKRSKPF